METVQNEFINTCLLGNLYQAIQNVILEHFFCKLKKIIVKIILLY